MKIYSKKYLTFQKVYGTICSESKRNTKKHKGDIEMTNIELLKKYATICKRQRDEAGCEECELNNSCLICAVDDSITIDNISMEKLLKDIENAEIPCRMIITISYSAEVIPLIFSIISLWDISDFLQNNMEDMIKPVINNVINAEWIKVVSVYDEGYELYGTQSYHGVQKVIIDVCRIEGIKNYKDALSTEIEKVFKQLGLDTTIKIEFEE